jgi:hypothetical protein
LLALAARASAAPGEPAAPGGALVGDDERSDIDPDLLDANEPPLPPDPPPGTAITDGPPTRDVIAAALRAASLADNPVPSWRRRSRLAGLVPQLSAHVGQDDNWRDVADATLGHVITYGVSASWRLERLVYDPSELRIATVDVLRRRERRRLAWYVISLYRAWRRTQNEDLAAQLDVVTDGWFSQHANTLKSH